MSMINTTLINVFLQERHFGVPNYALFNLMALTKDRNLIPRIELSIIDTSHLLNRIFYNFQSFFNYKFLIQEFIVVWLPMHSGAPFWDPVILL